MFEKFHQPVKPVKCLIEFLVSLSVRPGFFRRLRLVSLGVSALVSLGVSALVSLGVSAWFL